MTASRQQEIRELASKTSDRNIIFIYDGDFTDTEIEFFLRVRASINTKHKGV
ncbi:hypothetical protein [Vagococcus fluvialis]|uniref:hypothetical protein n=1 Tax=Vagococcus fluvialis TaxID=2738 RepID=UPI001D09E666|nr:hypothetical protein [Vagococcus fluvialis]UDM72782.1 hypothetical protein K5L00_14605 [Vagococcus fluvialis]UDM78338.1 hypothetical protein K5K98_14810 [Vagococcus fluvialis]UDM84057.1 hypothetical protein K5K96_14630 [Vagococcus fluvialis]